MKSLFHKKQKYGYNSVSVEKSARKKASLRSRLGRDETVEEKEQETAAFEAELEKAEVIQEEKRLRSERLQRHAVRGVQILLAILSVYTVFLTYGLLVTEYRYDEQGNVVPKIVSVEEIENQEVYDQLYKYYLQERLLYEDVLRLDYKFSLDSESKLIATEYEEMLDRVSRLTIMIDALDVGTKYGQIKNMLLEWVKTDMAVYLQNISAAILQNNAEKADEALACRNQMYNDFLILSENMAALGEAIPGLDLSDIYAWSPEKFISEVLEGVRDE